MRIADLGLYSGPDESELAGRSCFPSCPRAILLPSLQWVGSSTAFLAAFPANLLAAFPANLLAAFPFNLLFPTDLLASGHITLLAVFPVNLMAAFSARRLTKRPNPL